MPQNLLINAEGNPIMQESLGFFIGIVSAMSVWWLKQYLEQRRKRNNSLVAISAEIDVIAAKILSTIEGLMGLMRDNKTPEEYGFVYEAKVYNKYIGKLGEINNQFVIRGIVLAYGQIESFNDEIKNIKDGHKLPVFAKCLDELYGTLDAVNGHICMEYKIIKKARERKLRIIQDERRCRQKNALRKLILEKYPDSELYDPHLLHLYELEQNLDNPIQPTANGD